MAALSWYTMEKLHLQQTNGTTVLVPGSALGGGIAKLSHSMAWPKAEFETTPPSL